jgi:uncharacterized protein (DUF2147 family)
MKRSLRIPTGAALVLSLTVGLGAAQQAADAVGIWLNPDNGSNVEFYSCGGGLCAKIVKVTDAQGTDTNNPDPAKRDRPIVGLVIMDGAKQSAENAWSGTLYNRENGKSYAGTVTVKAKDTLSLSGCVMAVLCKTQTWTRLK